MSSQSFWNLSTSDPKRKFRWFLRFTTPGDNETLMLAVKSIDKPKFEVTNTQHQFINHQFNFPGRLKWEPLSATFVDLASSERNASDLGKILNNIITGAGYKIPDNVDACKFSITKDKAVSAFGPNFQMIQVDGDGKEIEIWKLHNPWVSRVEYGNLDYAAEDLVEVSVTIIYDWAERDE